ncbi:MAG: YitT family protein [Bacteroides sp.]|nr:YitT family protein [Bacteroides sp.]MCM1550112.1 YitT family protein [Clostridium sp.]
MVAFGNKNQIWNGLAILLGTGLMATAVNCVFEPMQLVTGGVTGIGIIVKELTRNIAGEEGIPLWITNLFCNVPLFIFAYYILGKRFVRRGIVSAIIFTIYLGVIPITSLPTGDLLLNSLLGAVLMGLGLGLVFAVGSTTGGMDLLAVLLQSRFRYLSEAQILAVVDGAIVIAGGIIFGLEHALYALLAIFIVTKVSDGIMNGLKFSKVGYVISDYTEEISQRIMSELQRGITGIDITGMHTKTRKNMLMCVVSRKEIVELKEIVFEIDPKAFVIVTDANETVGEGFLNYRAE